MYALRGGVLVGSINYKLSRIKVDGEIISANGVVVTVDVNVERQGFADHYRWGCGINPSVGWASGERGEILIGTQASSSARYRFATEVIGGVAGQASFGGAD